MVIFCPLTPFPKNPKHQNFEKMKNITGDIIILQMCTKNHDHMKYGFWDTNWDIFFCHFGPFLPFYPSNNLENQNLTKMKKASGDVIILHLCPKDHDLMMYASWDMECNRYTFVSIWARRYYPFTHVYHKWALWPF